MLNDVPLNALGAATICVATVGVCVALWHANFYRKTNTKLGDSIKRVFTTDALIYAVTVFFGVGALFHFDNADFAGGYAVRLVLMALNIYASISLAIHARKIVTDYKNGK